VRVVRILAVGSLDPAFGDGDGIMKYRRLVVGLSDVAVQPSGELALAGDALGVAIGEDGLELGSRSRPVCGTDELFATVVRRGGDARASG
jgi:hypothetical protein